MVLAILILKELLQQIFGLHRKVITEIGTSIVFLINFHSSFEFCQPFKIFDAFHAKISRRFAKSSRRNNKFNFSRRIADVDIHNL